MNAADDIWHTAANKDWNFFAGASILAAGLLLKFGAPVEAIVAGIALAGVWKWKGAGRFQRARGSRARK